MVEDPTGQVDLEETALRAAAGDRDALEDLLTAIQPRVRRICGRMLLHPQDAATEPGVGREDEVPQRLDEGPLVLDVRVHQLPWGAGHRLLPRRLHRDPPLAQALGRLRPLQLASGELPVQLGVDERHHVDPVDQERAEEQVVAVDVEPVEVDAAHRHPAHVGEPQGRALEAGPDEARALELVGA